jgi:predicted ATPase
LDDIQWSDDGSMDWIDDLARAWPGIPLMIVCLARPTLFERRPAWGEGRAAHTRLSLEALSPRESRRLVEAILQKAGEIPQALRELIVGGAEGNPFYVEEIIQMLIDERVIVTGGDVWRIEPARLAAATLPPTLTGVLQARLDGLPPRERDVLQRASVIGRTFWDSTLERLGAADEPEGEPARTENPLGHQEILDALQGLRRKELILRRETSAFAGAVEYVFKHDLLRQVAYESVLKKVRRAYHGQVGTWLKENSQQRVMEFAGLVAAHFEQAARTGEAAHWYGRAGHQARTTYAPASAIGFFQKALALVPATDATEREAQVQQLAWYEGLGEALGAQAKFAESRAAYQAELALAEAAGELVTQARAWNGLAFLEERQGNNRASVERADRAEALAREAGEAGRGERIRAMNLKGWACYRLGDAPAVLTLGEQTLKLCLELGDQRGLVTSYKLHGVAHLQLGEFKEADRFFNQGLALAQNVGDRRNACAMWSNLGESARLRGDVQAAAELYQKALAMTQEIGSRESEIIYQSNLAGARLGLRQFEQAERDSRRAISLAATPTFSALSETYSFLSEACLGQEKLAEALAAARRALDLARVSESELDQGGAWRALARASAALARGGPKDARSVTSEDDPRVCFEQSLRVFEQMNAEGEQARTLRHWAQFESQEGRREASQNMLARARAIFERLGAAEELERTETLTP